jgi:glutaconyl-CoA/methylmalonyl-CoA decarboxylase subunit gamma
MERIRITVDGKSYEVVVEKIDDGSAEAAAPPVRSAAPAARAAAPAPAPVAPSKPAAPAAAGDMTSPLAGIVQAIEVTVGAQVKEGDLVITLEAMKMYTPINATASGTIQAIHVKTGDAVEEGQPLFTIG